MIAPAERQTPFEVHPKPEHVGAEIRGIDIAAGIDDVTFASLRRALADCGVIFFRDQHLTPEQQIVFAKRWSRINVNRFFQQVDGYPQIAEVRKNPDQTRNIGGDWHTDHSYDQIPALGSILYAREVPAQGGDTMFTSMYAAYEALPDALKQRIAGLRALHSSRHVFGTQAQRRAELAGRIGNEKLAVQDAVHPVVIRHPDSGRRVLYVNPQFTVAIQDMPARQSDAVLQELYGYAAQPQHTCCFAWAPHSMAIWDNRATWHRALNDYPGEARLMHRITLEGVPLEAAA